MVNSDSESQVPSRLVSFSITASRQVTRVGNSFPVASPCDSRLVGTAPTSFVPRPTTVVIAPSSLPSDRAESILAAHNRCDSPDTLPVQSANNGQYLNFMSPLPKVAPRRCNTRRDNRLDLLLRDLFTSTILSLEANRDISKHKHTVQWYGSPASRRPSDSKSIRQLAPCHPPLVMLPTPHHRRVTNYKASRHAGRYTTSDNLWLQPVDKS